MYHFAKPTAKIVNEIKKLAAQTTDVRKIEKIYDMYTANVVYPIGKLTVTTGTDDYGMAWVNVKAERYDDLGRNNTIACEDMSSAGIAFAIGFTCGSAFWRATPYR